MLSQAVSAPPYPPVCAYSKLTVMKNCFILGLAQSVWPVSFFPLKHYSSKRNNLAKNKCIICAVEISRGWSSESVYTALLPCYSAGWRIVCTWSQLSAGPPHLCFLWSRGIMGSSAYSPLVRGNQQWDGMMCLAIIVQMPEKQSAWWILVLKCQICL